MFKIGDYNKLKIDRNTSVGFYLTDGEGNDVLLPNKYIKDKCKKGLDMLYIYMKTIKQIV